MLGAVILLMGMLVGSSAMSQDIEFVEHDAVVLGISFEVDELGAWMNVITSEKLKKGTKTGYSLVLTDYETFWVEEVNDRGFTAKKPMPFGLDEADTEMLKKEGLFYIRIDKKIFLVGEEQNKTIIARAKYAFK